jgi:Flp pilus assembly protein TadB
MHDPTERLSAERQPADEATRPPARPVPASQREWRGTQSGWRSVKRVALIRLLIASWLVILGSVFCAFGHWWGALLGVFLFALAGLHCWLAYRMTRSKRPLDAGQNVPDQAG